MVKDLKNSVQPPIRIHDYRSDYVITCSIDCLELLEESTSYLHLGQCLRWNCEYYERVISREYPNWRQQYPTQYPLSTEMVTLIRSVLETKDNIPLYVSKGTTITTEIIKCLQESFV